MDPRRWHSKTRDKPNPLRTKMHPRIGIIVVAILVLLPYSSISLPSGDPAPGRSPGPPQLQPDEEVKADGTDRVATVEESIDYDASTTTPSEELDVTTVSEVVSERTTVGDACAFARIPSDSDELVTLDVRESDVNLTVSHPVFETEELIRGVVYDGEYVDC